MPERSKASGLSRLSGALRRPRWRRSGIFSVVVLNVGGRAAARGGIDSVTSSAAGRDGVPMSGLSRSRSMLSKALSRCVDSPHRRAEVRRHRDDRLRQRARAERLGDLAAFERPLRRAAGAVHRVVGVDLRAELLRLGPVLALAARQREELRREQLEALDVAPLGVDLEQLGADREALRVAAHRLLEDLLGLQVAAVGEVDVGLGDRIDVADRVELRQRVGHRRRAAGRIARVDALAAAGAEERVGLQAALEERGLAAVLLRALACSGSRRSRRASRPRAPSAQIERIAARDRVDEARLGRRAGAGRGLAAALRRLGGTTGVGAAAATTTGAVAAAGAEAAVGGAAPRDHGAGTATAGAGAGRRGAAVPRRSPAPGSVPARPAPTPGARRRRGAAPGLSSGRRQRLRRLADASRSSTFFFSSATRAASAWRWRSLARRSSALPGADGGVRRPCSA